MSDAKDSNQAPAALRYEAATGYGSWSRIIVGPFFTFGGIAALNQVHLGKYDGTRDLVVGLVVGLMFVAGGLVLVGEGIYRLLYKVHSGSIVDPEAGTLTWWHGPFPAKRKVLSLDSIGQIKTCHGEDGEHIVFLDRQGHRIMFDDDALPPESHEWARQIGRVLPSIQVTKG